MAAEPSASHGEALWYVVGVIRPVPRPLDGVPPLLPGRPLQTVAGGGLEAVACTVPAGLLDEETVDDARLVGRLAVAHDRILRVLGERTAVVPARLGALFPSRQAVAATLDDRGAALRAALDQFSGRREWGVKVYRDPAGPGREPGAVQTGTAYLRHRQAERQQRAADQAAAGTLAAELHRAVAAQAHAAITRPPQHPKLSGVRAPMLLNAAYLVDVAQEDSFTAVLRELAGRHQASGLRIELTGPWPPYSFAGSERQPP